MSPDRKGSQMNRLDKWMEQSSRRVAQQTSRRNFLTRLSGLLVGGAAIPVLPVARAAEHSTASVPDESMLEGSIGDPTSCDYWRHCSIDGFACSCCGGSQTSCPPGTELAVVTWIGTCRNPIDGIDYVVSYNDCCGKSSCGRCLCNRNEGDKPMYIPPKSNDINWCQGIDNNIYHCTIAAVLGRAVEE